MELLRNFPRQYLNTDSFHLHLCPYSKGEGKAARQWIIPSYHQLAGFSISNPADAHSNPSTWTHACSLFLCRESEAGSAHSAQCLEDFIQEEKGEVAFVVIEALTGWCHVITVQTGGGGSLGWRWRYTKTNRRDRNTHYTGVNGHNRPVCLCLMPPTNKQQPDRWWKSLHDVRFYVCVWSRAFIHPSPVCFWKWWMKLCHRGKET